MTAGSGPRIDGPARARWTLVLAHGAGAGMDTDWMEALTGALADEGLRVVRFEFPYMKKRRSEGSRRPPDRMPVLESAYREQVEALELGDSRLAIGGKSMGGRVASHIADDLGCDALVCFGYPFHPPGKPDRLRTAHLTALITPCLIIQGERDPFGGFDEVPGYGLDHSIRVAWMADGDHGFAPRRRSGRSLEENLAEAAVATVGFLDSLDSGSG